VYFFVDRFKATFLALYESLDHHTTSGILSISHPGVESMHVKLIERVFRKEPLSMVLEIGNMTPDWGS